MTVVLVEQARLFASWIDAALRCPAQAQLGGSEPRSLASWSALGSALALLAQCLRLLLLGPRDSGSTHQAEDLGEIHAAYDRIDHHGGRFAWPVKRPADGSLTIHAHGSHVTPRAHALARNLCCSKIGFWAVNCAISDVKRLVRTR